MHAINSIVNCENASRGYIIYGVIAIANGREQNNYKMENKNWIFNREWEWNLSREATNFSKNDLLQSINAHTLLHIHRFSWHLSLSLQNKKQWSMGSMSFFLQCTFHNYIYIYIGYSSSRERERESVCPFVFLGHMKY